MQPQRLNTQLKPPEVTMRAIDIHAHMVPQALWRAANAGQEWHGIRVERDARGWE
jgi:hypothetical protein